MEWISVKNKLPELQKLVYVFGKVKGTPDAFPPSQFVAVYTDMLKGGNKFRSMGKTIITSHWAYLQPDPIESLQS